VVELGCAGELDRLSRNTIARSHSEEECL